MDVSTVKNDFATVKECKLAQTAFNKSLIESANGCFKVYYISDIHLLHHLKDAATYLRLKKDKKNLDDVWLNIKKEINVIVRNMFSTELIADIQNNEIFIIIFGGDISSDTKITEYFYRQFRLRYIFYKYKMWKSEHKFLSPVSKQEALKNWKNIYNYWKEKRDKSKKQLRKYVGSLPKVDSLTKELLQGGTKRRLPSFIDYKIQNLNRFSDAVKTVEEKKDLYVQFRMQGSQYIKPCTLQVYSVLGNHELIDFKTVRSASLYYARFFERLGINFLHNSDAFLSVGVNETDKVFIYGGIGFAKYNERFNASSLKTTTPSMSREKEILESDKFIKNYNKVLDKAKNKFKHLIVISHYPVADWSENSNTNSICTYFTGHTHRDDSVHTGNIDIYSNNQIGYNKKTIDFKSCLLGTIYNPFIDYSDGISIVTPSQYRQFLYFSQIKVQGIKIIERQLKKDYAQLYMVKRNGFYGFFIVNKKYGTQICIGGKTRSISKIKDIRYFDKYFDFVIVNYIKILKPYRDYQEQISFEVKRLGFSGKIHGCIIDIDFFNHIMVNPYDNSLTFYYSPEIGIVKPFKSFESLVGIDKLLKNSKNNTLSAENETLLNSYIAMKNEGCLITKSSQVCDDEKYIYADLKHGIYALSARYYQLQRLFDANILRWWNDDWIQENLTEKDEFYITHKVRYKTEEESDNELSSNYGKYIEIMDMSPTYVCWATKRMMTRDIFLAIIRKFVTRFYNRIDKFEQVNFTYETNSSGLKEFDFINVNCKPIEILEIYKQLLTDKRMYAAPITLEILNEDNELNIVIHLMGQSGLLRDLGNFVYKDKKFYSQDLNDLMQIPFGLNRKM